MHLNKTLEDLKKNFEVARQSTETATLDNDKLRIENKTLHDCIEVHVNSIENLRSFIDELESNNKELVRYIDHKNMVTANDYKTKVYAMLGNKRTPGDSAILRAPTVMDDQLFSQASVHQ